MPHSTNHNITRQRKTSTRQPAYRKNTLLQSPVGTSIINTGHVHSGDYVYIQHAGWKPVFDEDAYAALAVNRFQAVARLRSALKFGDVQ